MSDITATYAADEITATLAAQAVTGLYTSQAGALFDTGVFDVGIFASVVTRDPFPRIVATLPDIQITAET